MKGHISLLICILCSCCFLSACSIFGENPDGVSSATLTETTFSKSELMIPSKTAIVLYSSFENNTLKIANELASVLGAHILTPQEATAELLSEYDLVGFGSGIFDQQHHSRILEIAGSLSDSKGKRVFLFSTSGVSREVVIENDIEDPHDALRNIFEEKGCEVVGEFNCPGFNRNSFLILFGGINKGRPNLMDLQNARIFAEGLLPLIR